MPSSPIAKLLKRLEKNTKKKSRAKTKARKNKSKKPNLRAKSKISSKSCSSRTKSQCGGNPNCHYNKRLGCVRRSGVASGKKIYQGPVMPVRNMKSSLRQGVRVPNFSPPPLMKSARSVFVPRTELSPEFVPRLALPSTSEFVPRLALPSTSEFVPRLALPSTSEFVPRPAQPAPAFVPRLALPPAPAYIPRPTPPPAQPAPAYVPRPTPPPPQPAPAYVPRPTPPPPQPAPAYVPKPAPPPSATPALITYDPSLNLAIINGITYNLGEIRELFFDILTGVDWTRILKRANETGEKKIKALVDYFNAHATKENFDELRAKLNLNFAFRKRLLQKRRAKYNRK